jgi:hypothetical protein
MTDSISARLRAAKADECCNDIKCDEAADHIDAQDAKIKALVGALSGLREFVRDEEFCLCEYKDNTTPADEGPEIDAADAALAAAKETTA